MNFAISFMKWIFFFVLSIFSLKEEPKDISTKKLNRILVIIPLSGIGDLVMATPILWALREKYPKAHISAVANSITASLIMDTRCFDELLIYPKQKGLSAKIKFFILLRKTKYDLAITPSIVFSIILLAYMSRSKYKVGYNWNGRGSLFNIKIPYDQNNKLHLVDVNFNILRLLGINSSEKKFDIEISLRNKTIVKNFLTEEKLYENDLIIIFHPGAKWAPRRWMVKRFAKVADILIDKYKAKIIFSGGLHDKSIVSQIIESMKYSPIDVCGRFDLQQFASLVKNNTLFIGNDSGPMHIAMAMGTPVVALFGPGNIKRVAPYKGENVVIKKEVSCNPCEQYVEHKGCLQGNALCMKLILVEDVLEAITKLLMKKPKLLQKVKKKDDFKRRDTKGGNLHYS